jgi:hypothetical protein
MSISEADTRARLVDPRLRAAVFREELYKDYNHKRKTVKKMPEMGNYYSNVIKWDTTIKTEKNPRGGKKITKVGIERDAEDLGLYIHWR